MRYRKTLKEIMSMSNKETSSLSKEELISYTVILNSAANKRLKRIENESSKNFISTSALYDKKGNRLPPFKIKRNSDRNNALRKLTEAKKFLSRKTTLRDAKKRYDKSLKTLGLSKSVDYKTINELYKKYNELLENDRNFISSTIGSNQVLQDIGKLYKSNHSPDEIFKIMSDKIDTAYENEQEKKRQLENQQWSILLGGSNDFSDLFK